MEKTYFCTRFCDNTSTKTADHAEAFFFLTGRRTASSRPLERGNAEEIQVRKQFRRQNSSGRDGFHGLRFRRCSSGWTLQSRRRRKFRIREGISESARIKKKSTEPVYEYSSVKFILIIFRQHCFFRMELIYWAEGNADNETETIRRRKNVGIA